MQELTDEQVKEVDGGVVLAAIGAGIVIVYALDQLGYIDVF